MNIGGGCDRQVHRSTPWRSSALGDEGMQAPALSRRGRVERQRIKVLLNSSEPAHSQRAGLIVACDENSEVQLCQRDDANRRVLARPLVGRDQDRGIEQDRQPSVGGPGVCELPTQRLQIPLERGIWRRSPEVSQLSAGHPLPRAHGAELGHGTPRDGDRDPLAGLGAPQHLADTVA